MKALSHEHGSNLHRRTCTEDLAVRSKPPNLDELRKTLAELTERARA